MFLLFLRAVQITLAYGRGRLRHQPTCALCARRDNDVLRVTPRENLSFDELQWQQVECGAQGPARAHKPPHQGLWRAEPEVPSTRWGSAAKFCNSCCSPGAPREVVAVLETGREKQVMTFSQADDTGCSVR